MQAAMWRGQECSKIREGAKGESTDGGEGAGGSSDPSPAGDEHSRETESAHGWSMEKAMELRTPICIEKGTPQSFFGCLSPRLRA